MSKNNFSVLIGTDPEVFLKNEEGIINAIGIIPGTKEAPMPITPEGHFVQVDNVAAEFNIPPVDNGKDLFKEINVVFDWFKAYLPKGIELAIQASHIFKDSDLLHPDSWVFGCDPDFNAWTGEKNPTPYSKDLNLRSCGGHIHVGYEDPNEETNLLIIKWMDILLGAPSILLDPDQRRRELYGKMGAFRHKKFGVEYRTLSNFWIKSEELCNWVVENTKIAVKNAINKISPEEEDYESAKKAIEKRDEEACNQIIEKYGITIPAREISQP